MGKILSKIKKIFQKYRFQNEKQKKILFLGIVFFLLLLFVIVLIIVFINKREDVTYKETTVVKGILAEGITETGSVDVGTTMLSFDLDISEFTGESSFSFGGGMEAMMPGTQMQGSSGNTSSGIRQLEIEEVYVEAGQEIAENEPILKLTEESVESIRLELESDVSSAKIVYDQAVTSGQQIEVQANADYKMNELYASYAESQYTQTVEKLQETVTEREEKKEEAQQTLEEARTELAEKEVLLAEEKQVLENAVFTADGTDQEEALYWWIIAWQTKEDVRDMVDDLEEEIKTLNEEIKQYEKEAADAALSLSLAKKEWESGIIDAKAELDLRAYKAENAQEIYDVATEQGSFDEQKAQEDYEEAVRKLEEFDSVIVDQIIYSESGGLVTDISVAAGDVLAQNTDIVSLNNYDEVTVTLSVEEDDIEAAALGNQVNITVAAFPDQVFQGEVTEIGDAEINSNTNKTIYSVTVTVKNMGDLLYQDMTAEVTFVTDETEEVLYIPKRAIAEENGISYVKVKREDGSIERKKVTVGISDGVNTEIKEGLSEGETVLYESKVNKA